MNGLNSSSTGKGEEEILSSFEAYSLMMKKADLINGVFLENKRKKKWVDKKSGYSSFMLYPRALAVSGGNETDYWTWKCFKDMSDDNVEVVKLITICWLDVQGKFEISELSPEVDYEIVFIVRLAKGCSGWELPNTLKLSLPNGQVRERHVCLYEEPKGQWLELNVGNFRTTKGDKGEVSFNFSNTGGHWKCGLLFKGALIRPQKMSP